MSAKTKETGRKPGRPKKVESIPVSEFKRIINTRPTGFNVEFMYTYPITFKKFIETFNSCNVSEIFIHFSPECIKIQGRVNKNNTSVDQVDVANDDTLKLIILPSEVYSYYCDEDYYLKFKMAEWSVPLCDVDESVIKITLKYKRQSNTLSFEGHNTSVGCVLAHPLHLDIVGKSDMMDVDKQIMEVNKNPDIIFENVTASFKKILCKPCRKKSTNCRLELKKNQVVLRFSLDDRASDVIIPTLTEDGYRAKMSEKKTIRDELQVVNKTGAISNYKFPNSDIISFLLHMKELKTRMLFQKKSMVMMTSREDSTFTYYFGLEN